MKSLVAISLVLAGLSAFADEVVFSNVPRAETIYAISFANNAVQIQVESNGCTSKESFNIQKKIDPSDQLARILIIRNLPDWCRAYLPEGVIIEFSKEDLGLAPNEQIRIENPFGPSDF